MPWGRPCARLSLPACTAFGPSEQIKPSNLDTQMVPPAPSPGMAAVLLFLYQSKRCSVACLASSLLCISTCVMPALYEYFNVSGPGSVQHSNLSQRCGAASPLLLGETPTHHLDANERAELADRLGYRSVGAQLPSNVTLSTINSSLPRDVSLPAEDRQTFAAVIHKCCRL